ncbi:MAG: MFS transporter, partial [Gemmatimonadota bacterium]
MAEELTDQEKIRRLPWFFAHSAANSIFSMLTFFGPVFILFLGELGLPKTRIGLLLSLLPFSGLIALFIAPTVARLGVKRVFITCWGLRKVTAAFLLLTPWVLARYGGDAAFVLVLAVMAVFALLRAVAETAWFPWGQEIVPAPVRGRFNGINNSVTMLTGSLALGASSWVLDHVAGLHRFMLLMGAGVVFGVICVACALPIPGGAPGAPGEVRHGRAMGQALGDASFRRYLVYTAVVMVATQAVLAAFMPLFLKEEVGLAEGQILWLQVGGYATSLLSGFAWGWRADQRGSKPTLVVAMGLMVLLPVCWLVLPRHHELSFVAGLGAAALAGIASTGYWICDQRLLYVGIVPPARRTEYMAVYYAWIGLVGGLGPLLAGAAL